MKDKQYIELLNISNEISQKSVLKPGFKYSDILNTWNRAINYNKIQKSYEANEAIRTIELFDEETKQCQFYNIYTHYNRLNWFKLLIGEQCFLTKQQLRNLFSN
jgi:hypothetical protein